MAVSSSRPLMTDICTSAITHEVSFKWADRKNSSADANVWTVYPCDLRRLWVAARTDASSSIMEIAESVDKAGLPDAGTKRLPERRCPSEKWAANQPCKIILRFVRAMAWCDEFRAFRPFSPDRPRTSHPFFS